MTLVQGPGTAHSMHARTSTIHLRRTHVLTCLENVHLNFNCDTCLTTIMHMVQQYHAALQSGCALPGAGSPLHEQANMCGNDFEQDSPAINSLASCFMSLNLRYR